MLAIDLYNEITRLVKKDGRTGWISKQDFNDWSPSVESMLMSYYCDIDEQDSKTIESLRPFVKEVSLSITSSLVTLPNDYRKYNDLQYLYVANSENCGENAVQTGYDVDFIDSDEWYSMLRSPIRKPNLSKGRVRCRLVNNQLEVSEKAGTVKLMYVANPTYMNLAFTVNTGTQEEEYTPTGTINPMWLDKDRENLIDLYCVRFGLSIRDANLAAWAQSKQLTQK